MVMPSQQNADHETIARIIIYFISIIFIGFILWQYGSIYYKFYWHNNLCLEDDAHNLGYIINYYQRGSQAVLTNQYSVAAHPLGYRLLFLTFTRFASPFYFIKLTEIISYLLMLYFLWRIGCLLDGPGLALMISFVGINTFIFYSRGGSPHTFCNVLLVYFMYALLQNNLMQASISMILQLLLYPVSIIQTIPTLILFVLLGPDKKAYLRHIAQRKLIYIVLLTMFLILIFPQFFKPAPFQHHTNLRSHIIEQQTLAGPTFIDSWYQNFDKNNLNYLEKYIEAPYDPSPIQASMSRNSLRFYNLIYGNVIFLLLCIGFLITYYLGWFKIPRSLMILLGVSIIIYLFAKIFAYCLYEPDRMISRYLPLFSAILFPFATMKSIRHLFPQRTLQVNLVVPLCFITMLYIFVYGCFSQVNQILKNMRPYYCHQAKEMKLYTVIKNLPSDSLIAGHPSEGNVVDAIPLYSNRDVFLTQETHNFFYFIDYLKAMNQRTEMFFRAYYSTRIDDLLCLTNDYRVTHLLVYKKHLQGNLSENIHYYQLFDKYFKPRLQNLSADQLLLNRLTDNFFIYEDEDWKILDLKKLLAVNEPPGFHMAEKSNGRRSKVTP